MHRYSDDQVLEALRKGGAAEDGCLRDLYHRELPRMIAYVRKNNGNEEEARDLFQDTLVVFIEQVRANKYRGEATIGTYIYGIGRLMWINRLKRKGIEERYMEGQVHEEIRGLDTPLRIMLKAEQKKLFQQLMSHLGNKCRKLLNLKLYRQMNMVEIANTMGFKNEQNARNKHYKCKEELRKSVMKNPEYRTLLKDLP